MSQLLKRMSQLLKRISRRAAWTGHRGATERQRAAGLHKERTVRKKRPDEDFPKGFLRKRILRFVICASTPPHPEELGRKIRFRIETVKNGALEDGLETEFDGQYLNEIIENRIEENSVNGNYNAPASTKNRMTFDDVRILLIDERGREINAEN
jgi:hypothetical protein